MTKILLFYECPQFMDCRDLFDESFEGCPSKQYCLDAAWRTNFCTLPYRVDKNNSSLTVRNFSLDYHRKELIKNGWMWATKLPYT